MDNQTAVSQENDAESTKLKDVSEGKVSVRWGYEGKGAPAHWADLDPNYADCGSGQEQSPIDIPAGTPINAADLPFDYHETAVKIVNNGHAIQLSYDKGSSVEIDGEPYHVLEFHFHSPSEHSLDGQLTSMEMHIVHKNADGGLAVIGVMLVEGAENPAFAILCDNIPAKEGDAQTVDNAAINVLDLLPTDRSYYRYDGSLTTPPCSEGVKWHLMCQPVALSNKQIATFTAVIKANNRPIQPVNDRKFIKLSPD